MSEVCSRLCGRHSPLAFIVIYLLACKIVDISLVSLVDKIVASLFVDILQTVIGFSILIGIVFTSLFFIELYCKDRIIYLTIHFVGSFFFGASLCLFAFYMFFNGKLEDDQSKWLFSLLANYSFVVLVLDLIRTFKQTSVFNVSADVIKFSWKILNPSIGLVIFGLLMQVILVLFVFSIFNSQADKFVLYSEILLTFLLLEILTNIVHITISELIFMEVFDSRRWFSPFHLFFNNLFYKGIELTIFSIFTTVHHLIIVLRDLCVISVSISFPIIAFCSKVMDVIDKINQNDYSN